jgi:hypothetical protein
VKNDNGNGGERGGGLLVAGKMDIHCDRPAVMYRTAVLYFARYQV